MQDAEVVEHTGLVCGPWVCSCMGGRLCGGYRGRFHRLLLLLRGPGVTCHCTMCFLVLLHGGLHPLKKLLGGKDAGVAMAHAGGGCDGGVDLQLHDHELLAEVLGVVEVLLVELGLGGHAVVDVLPESLDLCFEVSAVVVSVFYTSVGSTGPCS